MAPVTELQCSAAREQCERAQVAMFGRLEDKIDNVAEKLDSLTTLYGRVAALENWKSMLNGRAAALAENPQAHHRATEEIERTHQRAADMVAEAAVVAADKVALAATEAIAKVSAAAAVAARTTPASTNANGETLPALPRWAVFMIAGFVLLVFALIATDKQYERMKKPLPLSGIAVTK